MAAKAVEVKAVGGGGAAAAETVVAATGSHNAMSNTRPAKLSARMAPSRLHQPQRLPRADPGFGPPRPTHRLGRAGRPSRPYAIDMASCRKSYHSLTGSTVSTPVDGSTRKST